VPGASDAEEDVGRLAVETADHGGNSRPAGQICAAAVHPQFSTRTNTQRKNCRPFTDFGGIRIKGATVQWNIGGLLIFLL